MIKISYSTYEDVYLITGLSSSEIATSDVTSLITLADNYIDELDVNASSGVLKLLSCYLTAHFIELRLSGNEVSMSKEGISVSNANPSVWLQMFNDLLNSVVGSNSAPGGVYVVNS